MKEDTMKEKLSVTVDEPLVRFLDSRPGKSRSEKLENILRQFRKISDEIALRRALKKHTDPEGARAEQEAWRRTMEHAQWSE
jgi:hypothetical protein